MLREALFAKIHRATVTLCNPDYMGSITIDPDLLDATGMRVNEKVLIADIDSMNRFETYVFRGTRGSGVISHTDLNPPDTLRIYRAVLEP